MTWENRIIVIAVGVFAVTLAWTAPAAARLLRAIWRALSPAGSRSQKE